MTSLELLAVTRVHGEGSAAVRALAEVSLSVAPGELLGVMGPSGSGKSTLLQLAGGLDTPTEGKVVVDGVDLGSLDQAGRAAVRRKHIGYVFQDLNLIPSLTAAENVALPRELDGVRVRQARKDALEALSTVGVDDLADRFPDELSGGQLDSHTGETVLKLIRARCDAGAAGVLVTHDARHAAWADRIVFLRDGVLIDDTGAPPSAESLLEGAS